jgi:hypothetical protein
VTILFLPLKNYENVVGLITYFLAPSTEIFHGSSWLNRSKLILESTNKVSKDIHLAVAIILCIEVPYRNLYFDLQFKPVAEYHR